MNFRVFLDCDIHSEGHYSNLWSYDHPIIPQPDDPAIQLAIVHTNAMFKLPRRVSSIPWDNLKAVPYIALSGAGYGYVGKKSASGNHEIAISRAVFHLRTWDEARQRVSSKPNRYTPDLAWMRK